MEGTSPSTESKEEASAMKGTTLLPSIAGDSSVRGRSSRGIEFLRGSRIHHVARKGFLEDEECARERRERRRRPFWVGRAHLGSAGPQLWPAGCNGLQDYWARCPTKSKVREFRKRKSGFMGI
jgi:hypothetical protein